jgi:A/G-specific adenine glycosylase
VSESRAGSAVPAEYAAEFAGRIVRWQQTHGRNSLPWQGTRDPYRVWLSEIMLQQTQVATVLDYYARFLVRFPDVQSLAAAQLDDVLGLWSGLGYYSRARNLHRCAQEVVASHGGQFPRSAEMLKTLPGIGRSTAAAIASFCFGERVAILDGNVKRVLTRVLGFGADLGSSANERALWEQAEALLPARDNAAGVADDLSHEGDARAGGDVHSVQEAMPRYTQGLMDLGATVCLAGKPSCMICPVHDLCVGRREGAPEKYPVKTRKLKRSAQSLWLLQAHKADGSVWLERRPPTGVWAGLFCLPAFESREALTRAVSDNVQAQLEDAPAFVHVLTHKDLHLHPVRAKLKTSDISGAGGGWFASTEWQALGLPAPVRRLLESA